MDKKHVEAALFVSKTPMTIEVISKIVNEDEKVVMRWLFELMEEYRNKGMIIKQVAGGFEMVSSPSCAEVVQQIVPREYETLSKSAFETLAIIAYKQPTRRSVIAKLRGVLNPDHGITTLVDRHLISETEDGYITTDEFLHFFAINDLKELPEVMPNSELMEEEDASEDFLHEEEGITENEKIKIKDPLSSP